MVFISCVAYTGTSHVHLSLMMFETCTIFFLQIIITYLLTVEKESRSKKLNISSAEKDYLGNLLTLDFFTPKQKIMCEVAEQLYGRKFKLIEAKTCDNVLSGEDVLKEKALSYFRYDMECCHNAITQLAFNMGKLAGDSGHLRIIENKLK